MHRLVRRILANEVRRNLRPTPDRADFVIVGAGTAGCVLANRLSANGKFKVVLVESGGYDTNPWIHVPVGYLYTMNNPKTNWGFSTGEFSAKARSSTGGYFVDHIKFTNSWSAIPARTNNRVSAWSGTWR